MHRVINYICSKKIFFMFFLYIFCIYAVEYQLINQYQNHIFLEVQYVSWPQKSSLSQTECLTSYIQ